MSFIHIREEMGKGPLKPTPERENKREKEKNKEGMPERAGPHPWGCSSVGRAPALQAGGQEFESLHLHSPKRKRRRCAETYELRELRSLSRVQARYKIKYFDLLINASI